MAFFESFFNPLGNPLVFDNQFVKAVNDLFFDLFFSYPGFLGAVSVVVTVSVNQPTPL